MNRIAILGTDTVAGYGLTRHLSRHSKATGLWFRDPVSGTAPGTTTDNCRVSQATIQDLVKAADVVVFCGDASSSSWNDGFGHFDLEKQWLDSSLEAAGKHQRRFVFVSSDAVFTGPRVFHNDDCENFSGSKTATELRRLESRVLKLANAMVVRTNILGPSPGLKGLYDQIVSTLESGESQILAADTYCTPISAQGFAGLLEHCLSRPTTGILNVSGAERTSLFRFASALATGMGFDSHRLIKPMMSGPSADRSLRCHRLRTELSGYPPMLKDVLESLQNEFSPEKPKAVAA